MSFIVEPFGTITYQAILVTGSTAKNLQSQATGAFTGTPVSCRTVFLRNPKANTAAVFIGDSTVTSAPGGNVIVDLQPGEGLFLNVGTISLFYAVSAAAQSLFVTAFK